MGWFGPASGDCSCCTCTCSFTGGFVYNDAGLLGSICLLQFSVGNLEDSTCAPIDVETASITIVLKRNTITITDPLFYDTVNNVIYWERWKPTAGDVYTADVTLDCGGGETFTQSYSFTIPTPANTSCDCCDDRVLDYVVVSGLTGSCCDWANGTFTLPNESAACQFDNGTMTPIFSTPASGCSGGYCFTATRADGTTFYLWPKSVFVQVFIGSPVTIVVQVRWYVFRRFAPFDPDPFTCYAQSDVSTQYEYEIECNTGNATFVTGSSSVTFSGVTINTGCSAPSVQLVFE